MTSADETLTTRSSSDYHCDRHSLDDGYTDLLHQSYHHHHHLYKSSSRLSMCTSNSTGGHEAECSVNEDFSSMITGDDADSNGYVDGIRVFSSVLSIESFYADDEQFSDEIDDDRVFGAGELNWDSDDDKNAVESSYHSLPATPPTGWIRKINPGVFKDYASENEAQKLVMMRRRSTNLRQRRRRFRRRELERRRLEDDEDDDDYDYGKDKEDVHTLSYHSSSWKSYGNNNSSPSGDSENGGGGGNGGLMVITRPKGGRRSLCLDLEEVKACKDLGFELDHKYMFEIMPSRLSLSTSTLDATTTTCSSGGNSPIANWLISSPGDDPKDVKARLKVWAQAVALASTSRHAF